MKTSRVPSKTGSSAATEKAPRLGAKEQTQAPASLISSLPIPYCANSLLYVDFIHGLPCFGGYDS